MPNLGPTELLILLGIVILIFGVGRLPEIGRGLGQSISGFRKAMKDDGKQEQELVPQAAREESEK